MFTYRRELSVPAAFDAVVRAHPTRVALVLPGLDGRDVSLTYEELDRRARVVAETIVLRGSKRGSLVATMFGKSLETIVGFLGILKAGCAYVPLDPEYPQERLRFMLDDTAADLILTGGGVAAPGGTPLSETTVTLQLAPVSFDAATLEIWGALLNGGTCVLYPACGVPEPELLRSINERLGVTTLWLTSSLFNLMIDRAPQAIASVREVLAGGEALSVPHIRRALELLPNTQLVNGYGPTESTTFTTCYRIPPVLDRALTSIPIGKAIAHTEVFVLDANKRPVERGEIGELHIGGDGLADGYLRRPELTRERFIDSSLATDGRLYATGDSVRILADGNIEFCGRQDDQVKISGRRIELGEIETALAETPGVEQTVVLAREDSPGEKRLVAYVVGTGLSAGRLRAALGARLPAYMVPAAFVFLERLPLSPMGKVDKRALPKPGSLRPDLEQAYVAPRSALEHALAAMWCETLELDSVGVHDRFFELGGTSLAAVHLNAEERVPPELEEVDLELVVRLRDVLGVPELSLGSLFAAPTVASLAEHTDALVYQRTGGATQKHGEREEVAF